MPRLAEDRQELYARHRANGLVPQKAAIAAGYSTGSRVYSTLENDEAVVARIGELLAERDAIKEERLNKARADAAEANPDGDISRAWVVKQLIDNAAAARAENDFKEANVSLKMLLEIVNSTKGGSAPTTPMRPGNLDGFLAATDGLESKRESMEDNIASKEQLDALITGHSADAPTANDRVMKTGSETDAALRLLDELDDEE